MLDIWIGSSPSTKDEIKKGLARLKSAKVPTRLSKDLIKHSCKSESKELSFIAGSDAYKFSTLKNLLNNSSTRNIMAVRGGYGGIRLLPLLDSWKPKNLKALKQKKIWGFSDQTTLQNYLYFRFGMSWVHSPMITSNSFHDPQGLEADFWEELLPFLSQKKESLIRYDVFCDLNFPEFLPKKTLELPMIGGNLACFNVLLSHPSIQTFLKKSPQNQKFAFFAEDVNEPAYKVDRLLQQLSQHPIFEHIGPICLGHFTDFKSVLPVIQRFAKDHKRPLLHGIPAGHDRPNLPIPMGRKVRINFAANRQALVTFDFAV